MCSEDGRGERQGRTEESPGLNAKRPEAAFSRPRPLKSRFGELVSRPEPTSPGILRELPVRVPL